jgi:adenine-specific DNA-methyltransferase
MISGSRCIQELPPAAITSLNKIIELKFNIIIGDAPGVDVQVQQYLKSQGYQNVTVYYAMFNSNGKPRNTSGFNVVGVRGNYVDRDKQMCSIANYGLAIWDGKSKGTAANIQRVPRTRVILA